MTDTDVPKLVEVSMNSTKALFTVSAAAFAALLAAAAPAAAAPEGKFATIYTLAQGPCVGQVDASVNGNAYPNQAAFTVSSTLIGVGPCTLPITLNWRNVDTGAAGVFAVTAQGPGYWGNSGHSALFAPGSGRFAATVTIGAVHMPELGPIEFTVPAYQG
ncbi:hypothetical protein OH799_34540 [Nocardia sp. NBC_00881]|uniref:hypothetical protein n=1 Tax=Nocardia sp. NBC_00881 TaxID=2975995 RepID=UPI00386F98C2|nr:hypothetical protein OH799_34540 [Nocardia sp. NBC_00881]